MGLFIGITIILVLVLYVVIGYLFFTGIQKAAGKTEELESHAVFLKEIKVHTIMYYWNMLSNLHKLHYASKEVNGADNDQAVTDAALIFAKSYGLNFKKGREEKLIALYTFGVVSLNMKKGVEVGNN